MGTSFRAPVNAKAFTDKTKHLLSETYLFEKVEVRKDDAFKLIAEIMEDERVGSYIDPPYALNTRIAGGYKCDFTDEDQLRLLKLITDPRCKCKIILSGYDSDLYDVLENKGFCKYCFKPSVNLASTKKGGKSMQQEVLWMNFNPLDNLKDVASLIGVEGIIDLLDLGKGK